ncbi:glycosyltransferase family 32 protein [Seonamhaeicola aphaedonensis]|uniref:Glycosyl transferase-like sugar-binding protein n=1 Tax=Seonamhaeicola aphaedonensis TaxID=1461338 RepID=A0A3D9H5Z6_9FLAO|nr:glycosyltransferase [Seonamhaeicola aphaedonensis]RED44937.1 glycosyl transferase-like sugar-binding protein [Seonamhaeicola aphaedonensis]
MIPKKIHFCWYGKGSYNSTIEKCIASWKEQLPDYEIKKWDETNTPFNELPFLKLLYKQKKWSFITDYIRLYSIYLEGGIYLDTDIEIIKPFGSLHEESAFIGFQTKSIQGKYPLNSAVIGSSKQNPFVLDCIKATEIKQRLNFNAMGGPPIVSSILRGYGLTNTNKQHLNNILLLPYDYFYPFSWEETYSPECITENTICIHWWEDSWKNKHKGIKYYLESTKRKLQKLPLVVANRFQYAVNKNNFYLIEKLIQKDYQNFS